MPATGLFFGSVAFLIITSYLREHRHHPVGKNASHEPLHYEHKSAKTGKATSDWKGVISAAHRIRRNGRTKFRAKDFPPK